MRIWANSASVVVACDSWQYMHTTGPCSSHSLYLGLQPRYPSKPIGRALTTTCRKNTNIHSRTVQTSSRQRIWLNLRVLGPASQMTQATLCSCPSANTHSSTKSAFNPSSFTRRSCYKCLLIDKEREICIYCFSAAQLEGGTATDSIAKRRLRILARLAHYCPRL